MIKPNNYCSITGEFSGDPDGLDHVFRSARNTAVVEIVITGGGSIRREHTKGQWDAKQKRRKPEVK
ncbi:MAG: hypothetical protein AB7G06_04300 [Bdellovibrionales bacterium]